MKRGLTHQFRFSATWLFAGAILFSLSATAQDRVMVTSLGELRMAARSAKPGTTIEIAAGKYEGGFHAAKLHGTAKQPITIRALDPKNPPVFSGGNGLHLSDAVHVRLEYLTVEGSRGNGINIDDGGSFETPSHDLALIGLTVRDIGPEGNRDGIKLSGIDHFLVEECTIERWGSNGSGIDMVGCHQGRISGCTFRHKPDVAGGNGVQTKGGSSEITVQRCRFEHSGGRAVNIGGSTGLDFFRPKDATYEARDITVEDCTFVECVAPICFVGVDGATVRHNTIFDPKRYVIQILQETTAERFVPCRNGTFMNNLVVFRSDQVRGIVNVGTSTDPKSFAFSHNHWYCVDRPDRSSRFPLPVSETGGVHGVDPKLTIDRETGEVRYDRAAVANAGARPQ